MDLEKGASCQHLHCVTKHSLKYLLKEFREKNTFEKKTKQVIKKFYRLKQRWVKQWSFKASSNSQIKDATYKDVVNVLYICYYEAH